MLKRWMALFLVLTLTLTAASCRSKEKDPPSNGGSQTTDTSNDATEKTPLQGNMEDNVTKLMQAQPVEFMGGFMPVDLQDTTEDGLWALKNFTGLDSAEKLTDIAIYEPMSGSQAFSLILARVADAVDAKTVAQQMKDNINPRKWICVGADQIAAAGYGDVVLFVMLDSNLGLSAQSYVDAFANICGGKLDFTL